MLALIEDAGVTDTLVLDALDALDSLDADVVGCEETESVAESVAVDET